MMLTKKLKNSINILNILIKNYTFYFLFYHKSFLNSFFEHFPCLNRYFVFSNISRYCADVMAARETSDNWMWKQVLKLDDVTIQWNINKCNKTYYKYRNTNKLIKSIKVHLYYKHKIWTEEDRLKWENDNDFVWQYFDKIDLYKGKCKFCKNFYREAYKIYI